MTSATFASLPVPAMEDSMEVSSSPAGNQLDGDIDIDFGDYVPGTHLTDDEHMLEDGEPLRPATATDDMMDDADHTLHAPIVEEIMQDGPESEQQQQQHELADEELIDYDDEDTYEDQAQASLDAFTVPQAKNSVSADADVPSQTESVGDTNVRDPEHDATAKEASTTLLQETALPGDEHGVEGTEVVETHTIVEQDVESKAEVLAAAQEESYGNNTANGDVTEEFDTAQVQTDSGIQGNEDESTRKAPPQLSGSLNVGLAHTDGPPTPTDTGLHPVMLKFEGYEFPLFKSRAQPEGLLKDDNLASISLATLLIECRQRLAIKTGETISDEHELCLGFDHLGLVLSESSRSAAGTSLNDVLEVYLQLHENDGTEDAPPLSLSLTRALRFDSSFNILKQAATQGQGMSNFSFLDSGHHDNFYQENNAAEYDPEEDSYHDADEQGQDHTEGQEAQEYDGQDEQGQQDSLGNGADDQTGEYHDDEYPEGQFGEYDENEEYPDPEDYDQEPHEQEAQEDPMNGDDATGEAPEDAQEVVIPESAASSATVRNDDTANYPAGEYDPDDLIDWDDDGLTTKSTSETYEDEGTEDFSTFLTEYDADATQDNDEAQEVANPSALKHTDQDKTLDGHDEQAAVDLASEDLLQYEQPEDETEHEGAEYFNEAGEDLDQHEANKNDQADNLVHDDHDDFQLGEEDEQFHTAYDLLDGDEPEELQQNEDATGTSQQTNGADINEDDIDFDDDIDFGDHQSTAPAATSKSPAGKRSYEDHIEDDELDFGEPDLKKARSD